MHSAIEGADRTPRLATLFLPNPSTRLTECPVWDSRPFFDKAFSMGGRTGILIGMVFGCLLVISWSLRTQSGRAKAASSSTPEIASAPPDAFTTSKPRSLAQSAPTSVYAHNLKLRKGSDFRIYVPWLRGHMIRTRHDVNASFDDPDSFVLDVDSGIIRANLGDLVHYLNVSRGSQAPLKNITLTGDGDHVTLRGTVHKLVSLPVSMEGTISPYPDRQIRMHVTKLSVLKVPLKGILGAFKLTVADLFDSKAVAGIRVSGNDVYFDTQQLLPPPHIRGQFTAVRIQNPDVEVTYGDARTALAKVEQWRNFLRLREGSIDFGKLTMHHVDLIMIDTSDDAWFDLDLNHYQEQLVNGYTRMTPQAGLQIFMPDLDRLPRNRATRNIGIEWMKNRNIPPPPEVVNR